MITKKTVNGKDQITSCTLATCCLTVVELETDPIQLKLSNEKGEELTCSLDEFREIVEYLYLEGPLKLDRIEKMFL